MRGRQGPTLLALAVVLQVSVFASLCTGAVRMTPGEVVRAILGGPGAVRHADILVAVRAPRVALACIVGASLAVSGAILQGVFMNPLADPYVIGVSSGASFGAVVAIILNPRIAVGGLSALPLFAMAGALAAILLVQRLSLIGGRSTVTGLLLSGVAVSSFLSAAISAVTYVFGTRIHQVWLWLMGGLSQASWDLVIMAAPYCAAGIACSFALSRELNAITLGEETAAHLGVNVGLVRGALVWAAALLTASAVSSAGLIGFVGMVVPHVCRMVSPDHRFLIPAAALAGAASTVICDAAGRGVAPPLEVPVGIITALIGGPVFVYLLGRVRGARAGNPGGAVL
ncbi:MAG: iron ABC transporter permease [Firmicutes bacterium]|nr:iron ABC transporter permease [Bacillota bacterium]